MSDPCKLCSRKEIKFSDQEKTIISGLIMNLRDKGVVQNAKHEQGEIISSIFIHTKPDGTYRLILNLSWSNDHMEKIYFKMDTLKTALNLVKKNCFFAKLDIKDSYYSIHIKESDRKFLRFMFFCGSCGMDSWWNLQLSEQIIACASYIYEAFKAIIFFFEEAGS